MIVKYKRLSIVIPVYNEQRFVKKTLARVMDADSCGLKKEIIIVNDGSSDNTPVILKRWYKQNKSHKRVFIKLIHHKNNMGKGAAIKTGFKSSTGDVILIQDSDFEYNPKDYPSLLKPFFLNNIQVVYGSRTKGIKKYKNKYSSPFFYVGGLILTWYINILYSQNLTDQPTGYKVISKKVLPFFKNIIEDDFTYEIGITAKLAKNNIKIMEVPISYNPRSVEEGKKINFLDFIKSLLVGLKYRI